MESDLTLAVIIMAIAIGAIVLLFLVLRKLVLWYYRVNEAVQLQQRNNFLLEKIYTQLGGKPEEIVDKSNEKKPDKLSLWASSLP